MSTYQRPSRNLHKSFLYLNDEIVVNSLSALEAGKVDEVVSKAVTAREGGGGLGFNAGTGMIGGKAEVSKKGSSTMEEAITRTRTRFSIFQLWFDLLDNQKALGKFQGWGDSALVDVRPGDTIVLIAELSVVPIHGLARMYLWYVDKASQTGHPFSLQGAALKEAKASARDLKMVLGNDDEGHIDMGFIALPEGDVGPKVAMNFSEEWLISDLGTLSGYYTIVAQVQKTINEGDWLPMMRLISGAPCTTLERDIIREMLKNFTDAGSGFDIEVNEFDGEVHGPALWLEPIAIYR